MNANTLQPFERSFMISPRTTGENKTSYLFTPPPDTDNFLVETFHQYPHGNFSPTFYNPFEVKHRRRTSNAQLKILEEAFKTCSKPSASVRRLLAQKLNMSVRGVQIWFQNRRAKEKELAKKEEDSNKSKDDNTNKKASVHVEKAKTPILFSDFSTSHQHESVNSNNVTLEYPAVQLVSDKVRSLATNAAMVAVSSSNWPTQYPSTRQNSMNSSSDDVASNMKHSNFIYVSPSWSSSSYSEV